MAAYLAFAHATTNSEAIHRGVPQVERIENIALVDRFLRSLTLFFVDGGAADGQWWVTLAGCHIQMWFDQPINETRLIRADSSLLRSHKLKSLRLENTVVSTGKHHQDQHPQLRYQRSPYLSGVTIKRLKFTMIAASVCKYMQG
jgi:hypothetical protein